MIILNKSASYLLLLLFVLSFLHPTTYTQEDNNRGLKTNNRNDISRIYFSQNNTNQENLQIEKEKITKETKNLSCREYENYCHNFIEKKKYDLSIYCYESNMEKHQQEINQKYPIIYRFIAYSYIKIGDFKKAKELMSKYCLYAYYKGIEPVTKELKPGFELMKMDLVIYEFLSAHTRQSLEKAVEYAKLFKQKYPDFKDDEINSADRAIEEWERIQKEIREEKKRNDLANSFFSELVVNIKIKDKEGLYNLLKKHAMNEKVLNSLYSYYIADYFKQDTTGLSYKIIKIEDAHPMKNNKYKYWSIKYNIIIDNPPSDNHHSPTLNLLAIFNDSISIDLWE